MPSRGVGMTTDDQPPRPCPPPHKLWQVWGVPLPLSPRDQHPNAGETLQTWWGGKTFATPELIYTGRYFMCQQGQPNIKLTPWRIFFCYIFSFSAANSFYQATWGCSRSRVWLQRTQAGDSSWRQTGRNERPGKQGWDVTVPMLQGGK